MLRTAHFSQSTREMGHPLCWLRLRDQEPGQPAQVKSRFLTRALHVFGMTKFKETARNDLALHAAYCPLLAKYARNGAPSLLVAPARSRAGPTHSSQKQVPHPCFARVRNDKIRARFGMTAASLLLFSLRLACDFYL